MSEMVCVQCGASFAKRRAGQKYCTLQCKNRASHIKERRPPRMVTERCRQCQQPFERPLITPLKYCSEACNKTARRARTTADYHRAYASKKRLKEFEERQKEREEYAEVVVPLHLRPKPYEAVCLLCGTATTTFMLSDLELRALKAEQAPQCRCGARMQLEPTLMSRAARVAS